MTVRDHARGFDRVDLTALLRLADRGYLFPVWTLHKFSRDRKDRIYRAGRDGVDIAELIRQFPDVYVGRLIMPGNLFLNEGINELWTLGMSTGGTKFDNTNAYIGAGDSNTAADPAQTGLQASTNKLYKAMDATYPQGPSAQKVTWRSTFGASEANFAWNEITVANGNSDSAKNLNRKVQVMGTKASPAVWIPSLELTIA